MKRTLLTILATIVFFSCEPEKITGNMEEETYQEEITETDTTYIDTTGVPIDTTITDTITTPIVRNDFITRFTLRQAQLGELFEYNSALQTRIDKTIKINNSIDSTGYHNHAIIYNLYKDGELYKTGFDRENVRTFLWDSGYIERNTDSLNLISKGSNISGYLNDKHFRIIYPLVLGRTTVNQDTLRFTEPGIYYSESILDYSIEENKYTLIIKTEPFEVTGSPTLERILNTTSLTRGRKYEN